MTRKDYVAIAEAIKRTREALPTNADLEHNAVCRTARNIALVMLNDNPRFDVSRFLKACGVQL